jgi:ABC-2 type transport system ATP-binding protein
MEEIHMFTVDKLRKTYPLFTLKDVSFELPAGYITGFIGVNGAGKTTTLKSIMNIIRPDAGRITLLGKDMRTYEFELKQKIGFMLGPFDFYQKHPVRKIVDVYKRFYDEWDDAAFVARLKRFHVDDRKNIGELSAGMQVKLGIAMALSHNAKLIILDEPTSGLDPVAREEFLYLLREIVGDGQKSVLFSTHITSDLDKCADYVLFIRQGELIAFDTKDDLLSNHILVSGKGSDLSDTLKSRMIDCKTTAFGFTGLMHKAEFDNSQEKLLLQTERPALEDIMVYYNRSAK